MKRISAPQSRRNRARRQRKVKARHAKAGHWSPQARPLFTAGPVHYEIGAHPDVTPYGRDPLWRYRRDASAGDQAGPAERRFQKHGEPFSLVCTRLVRRF